MNIVWLILTLFSLLSLLFSSPDLAISSMAAGANRSVTLALSLLAGYSVWLSLFDIVEKTGLSTSLSKALSKPVRFLFPSASVKARGFICMNIASNLLGLGNASTPMGVSAVNAMFLGDEKATDDMITLLVLSSTSLQLIPSTIITMRINHGSISPTAFLPACIVATVTSTALGITLCKILPIIKKRKALPFKKARKAL